MTSAYFAPMVALPIVITEPGLYLTRSGEVVEIVKATQRHEFGCRGTYSNGIAEAWHRSGRLFSGMLSANDVVSPATKISEERILFCAAQEGAFTLAYSAWFRAADGNSFERNGFITVEVGGPRSPEAIRDAILASAKPLAGECWTFMEASTPLVYSNGVFEGGYLWLKMVREAA